MKIDPAQEQQIETCHKENGVTITIATPFYHSLPFIPVLGQMPFTSALFIVIPFHPCALIPIAMLHPCTCALLLCRAFRLLPGRSVLESCQILY